MGLITREYRNWVRNRTGTLHKNDADDRYKGRQWRINQNHIRETLMDEYNSSGYRPGYMITRNYYYDQQSRKEVVKHNKRMNDVIDDFFNPRGSTEYLLTHDHFIERHKDKLVKKAEGKRAVLNTITQEYELDWCQVEIKKGAFHVHTLVSEIDDDVITNRTSRIQKAIEKIYGFDEPPHSLMQSDEGMTRIKKDLLDYAIRDRCDFMGNSDMSLDIKPASEYGRYDGYEGWKGLIAYATKTCYNVDNMIEVYDHENNNILCL